MKDTDTVLWTLRSANGYLTECLVRFAQGGVQVEVFSDGSPIISRVFTTGAEAVAWAEEEREALERGE